MSFFKVLWKESWVKRSVQFEASSIGTMQKTNSARASETLQMDKAKQVIVN